MAEILAITAAVVAFIAITAILVPVAAILRGYALSVLWGWFAVPLFGLPPIGVPAAIGVALIAGILTHEHQREPEAEGKYDAYVSLAGIFVRPLAALLFGWIVKGFMP